MTKHRLLSERPWLNGYISAPEINLRVEIIDELFLQHTPAAVSDNRLNATDHQWQEVVWISKSGERVGNCSGIPMYPDMVLHEREAPDYHGRTNGESLLEVKDPSEIAEAVEITRFFKPNGGGNTSAQIVIRKTPKRFTLVEWLTAKAKQASEAVENARVGVASMESIERGLSYEFKNRFLVDAGVAAISGLSDSLRAGRFASLTISAPTQQMVRMKLDRLNPREISTLWLFDREGNAIEQLALFDWGRGNARRMEVLSALKHKTLGFLLCEPAFQNVAMVGYDELWDSPESESMIDMGERRRNFTLYPFPMNIDLGIWIGAATSAKA